jgi:uncharacterized protein (TIGR02145 family)
VPSDAEWTILTTFLGGEEVAGGKMKSTGTSLWLSPNIAATNESGFTGLPGGCREPYGTFVEVGFSGHWWSSSENDTEEAWNRNLYYGNGGEANREYFWKKFGFSVRCIKD